MNGEPTKRTTETKTKNTAAPLLQFVSPPGRPPAFWFRCCVSSPPSNVKDTLRPPEEDPEGYPRGHLRACRSRCRGWQRSRRRPRGRCRWCRQPGDGRPVRDLLRTPRRGKKTFRLFFFHSSAPHRGRNDVLVPGVHRHPSFFFLPLSGSRVSVTEPFRWRWDRNIGRTKTRDNLDTHTRTCRICTWDSSDSGV